LLAKIVSEPEPSPSLARAQLSAVDVRTSQQLAQFAGAHKTIRRIAILLAHSGDSPIWVVGLVLLWWLSTGLWRREAQFGLLGILVTAIVVQLIKWRVKRPRPVGEWGQGYRRVDPHSFPSGHAARTFMLAVVALFLGPPWWAVALVVWAPLVCIARVAMRVHYLSDVIVGALCGLACGVLICLFVPF
jgi:membrane-associated phospholipid phosphatase